MKIPLSSIFCDSNLLNLICYIYLIMNCSWLFVAIITLSSSNVQFVALVVILQPNQGTEENWASLEFIT